MIVQNSIMGLNAQRQTQLNNLILQSSLQKLSSGLRINSASDDAAGLAISEKMRAQYTGMDRAILNAQDGKSLVGAAEGALGEVHSMLNRLTDLSLQASNGILNADQRASIQDEANSILAEIDRISEATNFNGIQLFDGSLAGGEASGFSVNNASVQPQVAGVNMNTVQATAGQTTFEAMPEVSGLSAGQEVTFSMELADGSSYQANFTVNDTLDGLVSDSGQTYALAASANDGSSVDVASSDMAEALAGEMAALGMDAGYALSANNGQLTVENQVPGTETPAITGLSFQTSAGVQGSVDVASSVDATAARGEIAASDMTVYNGSNQADATFSVNGQDFMLVNEADYDAVSASLQDSGVTAISVSAQNGSALSTQDLNNVASAVNMETGAAFGVQGDNLTVQAAANQGGGLQLQIGDTADPFNQISVNIGNLSTSGLGIDNISFASVNDASRSLDAIRNAINQVSTARGELGATDNRLDSTINNLAVTSENMLAAESRIRDSDMAKEYMNFIRQNILGQSGMAMQAQANLQSQQVLQLLR